MPMDEHGGGAHEQIVGDDLRRARDSRRAQRDFARPATERQRVDPPDWALQPIPEVTQLGPTLAARLGSDR
jgi:hypothetical protein